MNYEEFAKQVVDALNAGAMSIADLDPEKYYDENGQPLLRIELVNSKKTNGERLGISFKMIDSGLEVGSVVYLEYYWELYRRKYIKGPNDAAVEILRNLKAQEIVNLETQKKVLLATEKFNDKDYIQKNVEYYLVNTNLNQHFDVRTDIEDLGLSYLYYIETDLGYVQINKSILNAIGATKEQLHEWAKSNTAKLNPAECIAMDMILEEFLQAAGDNSIEIPMTDGEMYCLTNVRRRRGAVAMMYEGALREISDKLNADLYILPSSIEEVILLPENGINDPDALKQMVTEVNAEEVPPELILSEHVFKYIRAEDKIIIIR